jgi:hypothetical protein
MGKFSHSEYIHCFYCHYAKPLNFISIMNLFCVRVYVNEITITFVHIVIWETDIVLKVILTVRSTSKIEEIVIIYMH